jgi:asparagine synthase (glutamine-hydrolysing)
MAFGIEARVPLLDHRLVEFCLGLDPELKIRKDRTKVLLREAMSDIVPWQIVNRQDKKGYPTPLALWLRNGLYHEVREFLLAPEVRKPVIFDRGKLDKLLEEHRLGKADLDWEVFQWISCKLWLQIFFEGGSCLGA